jgi:four helix bundle protein
MIRSSRSSTACIAEGYGRFHYQENIQFCRQSRGSLYELLDHLDVAKDCGHVNAHQVKDLIAKVKSAIQVLNGYIRYLRQKKGLT